MSEEQYLPNEIWFGYVDRNKGRGVHRPVVAWKITTIKNDEYSFLRFDGDLTEDILCTVLR